MKPVRDNKRLNVQVKKLSFYLLSQFDHLFIPNGFQVTPVQKPAIIEFLSLDTNHPVAVGTPCLRPFT